MIEPSSHKTNCSMLDRMDGIYHTLPGSIHFGEFCLVYVPLKENSRSSSFIRVFLSLLLPWLCFKYVSDQRSSCNNHLTFWLKNHVFTFRPWGARSFCCSLDFWPPQIDMKFAQDHYKFLRNYLTSPAEEALSDSKDFLDFLKPVVFNQNSPFIVLSLHFLIIWSICRIWYWVKLLPDALRAWEDESGGLRLKKLCESEDSNSRCSFAKICGPAGLPLSYKWTFDFSVLALFWK